MRVQRCTTYSKPLYNWWVMSKQRVNWTITKDTIKLLKDLERNDTYKRSISQLVEHAIQQTYRSPLERKRDERRYHAMELARLEQDINILEEKQRLEQDTIIILKGSDQ